MNFANTPPQELVSVIASTLADLDPTHRDEIALRDTAAQALRDAGLIPVVATSIARVGRVELLVGSIAVECATDGTVRSVHSRVARLAGSRDIHAVVLVTTNRAHVAVPGLVKATLVRTGLLEERP